ncbi:Eaa1 [Klebsiella pneumoniae]|nr:Eaa1 [Klebsiella pneumoniae]
MTKSTITRERLAKIKSWRETYGAGSNVMLPAEEAEELARMALAAMDSEPVAFTEKHEILNMHSTGLYLRAWPADRARNAVEGYTIPLYRHAQPASERDQVRIAHAEWSQATFGNVGPVGQLKHLSKEALEAAAEPGDLSEWADMQFLLWDAQRRAGVTDEQITQAMIDKLAVNKQRSWPEPKDGEPRLHIKERPRKKVDRCDVCTEGARGGCGTCIFNGNFD